MTRDTIRQGANVFFASVQLVAAFVIKAGITGLGINAISNEYPTYVAPARYALFIWNYICLHALAYTIFQALPRHRHSHLLRRIGWFSACAFLAATLWAFLLQSRHFVLSTLALVTLLILLSIIVARVMEYRGRLGKVSLRLVHITFSIYLGWVTMATITHVAQMLVALGWSGWGISDVAWGVIMLIAGAAIASAVTASTRSNIPYAIAVLWTLTGIAVNAFDHRPPQSTIIGVTAIAAAIAVIVTLLVSRLRLRAR